MQTRGNKNQSRDRRTPSDYPGVMVKETLDCAEEPQRYAGYQLLDPLGQKIGTVRKVFASSTGDPQYVQAKVGFRKSKMLLIPTDRVALDEDLRTLTLL